MSEVVAIVGSRDYQSLERVAKYISTLPPGTVVRTGDARGVDKVAREAARKRGLVVDEVKADWDDLSHHDARIVTRADGSKYDANAGKRRNPRIVAAPDTTRVVAFHDGKSPGTRHAVEVARAAGKPVRVIGP